MFLTMLTRVANETFGWQILIQGVQVLAKPLQISIPILISLDRVGS